MLSKSSYPNAPEATVACLSVFDLDHTLAQSNVSLAFGRFLHRRKRISLNQAVYAATAFLWHRWAGCRLDYLHRSVFYRLFKGWPLSDLVSHVDAFLDEQWEQLVDPAILRILEGASRRQCYTMLLSNSPDFLVRAIARRLQIDEWGATTYAVDKAGRLCHIASYFNGREKALLVERRAEEFNVARSGIWVCSDSILDLPLFQVAGRCSVVRPDRALRKIARQQGWEMIT